MKKYMKLLIQALALVTLLAMPCYGSDQGAPVEITTSGIVKKQGMTTYMYGTHVLSDDSSKKMYALRSRVIDLNRLVDQRVTVKGTLVPGYPVDFGPDFVEVTSVDKK